MCKSVCVCVYVCKCVCVRECVSASACDPPVSCGGDEVYAAVHPGVRDPLLPVDVDLLLQVRLVLVVDELHDGLPAEGTWEFRD